MRAHLRLMWNQASDTVLKLIKLLKWFEPSLGWWPHGRTKIKIRKKERSHAAYFSFTVSIRSICWEILPSNFVTVLFIVFATFVFHFEDNDNFFFRFRPLKVFIKSFFCNQKDQFADNSYILNTTPVKNGWIYHRTESTTNRTSSWWKPTNQWFIETFNLNWSCSLMTDKKNWPGQGNWLTEP